VTQIVPSTATRLIELGHPFREGMPHLTGHEPFLHELTKLHGEDMRGGGASGAGDRICLNTHCGTHIDSVFHVSRDLRLYGGHDARKAQAGGRRLEIVGERNLSPIWGRGLLVDVATTLGVGILDEDFAITPEVTEQALEAVGATVEAGDVVLFRTGWATLWVSPDRYIASRSPGPTAETARWLSSRSVQATGSDTAPFELFPTPDLAAHVVLLVESGIPIIENLNLEQLAREQIYEFQFAALPLMLEGATGSPISPVAIVHAMKEESS
jgi:kynurenine formamidase